MRILLAPDSLKGTLSSRQAGKILEEAVLSLYPSWETEVIPMADGGEGTVEAMAAAAGGKAVVDPVTGPLGWPVQARSLRLPGDVAVMEMAEASGLLLVPEEKRNPLITSTFGTGEMIDRALARGDRHIYIGIGGSATCDGGMGAMEALGVRFLDRNGRKLPGQGASLGRVETIDLSCLHEGVEDMDLTILSDVTNPLWGERGAARAFGPQKGADPVMVEKLEAGMVHYGRVLEDTFGVDVEHLSGGGAAGGLGAALLLFLHGTMASGAEKILELSHFDERLKTADLVVTGEGRTDRQSGEGKITGMIAAHCKKKGVPCVVLSGSLGEGWESLLSLGADRIIPAAEGADIKKSMKNPALWYRRAAEAFFREWGKGK